MSTVQIEFHYTFFATLAVLTLILGVFVFSIIRHLRIKRSQIRTKSLSNERSVENDRKRIVSDIHDDFGSLLTGLKFNMKKLANHDSANELLLTSCKIVDESLARIKEITLNLVPRELEREGFHAAMEALVERLNTSGVIVIHYDGSLEVKDFNMDKALIMFRIVQELLTNAIKHSNATLIEIGTVRMTHQFIREIRDNGKGFDYEDAVRARSGSGLKNVSYRLDLLDGAIMVDSYKDIGTQLFHQYPA